MDQPKIERMLRLMKLLSGGFQYTVDELSDKLEMSPRTIYRYIDTFKGAGFVVNKVCPNVYRLESVPDTLPDFDKLVYFSEEESYLINSLIDTLMPTNSLKKGIKDKLAVIYDSTSIADYVDRRSNANHVQELARAAREKKRAVLKDYESGRSHTIKDRIVEPYGFTTDYLDVCAYDLEDGQNKIFKINRIGEVQVQEILWSAEELHRREEMDIFRMTGEVCDRIEWEMSVLAKNLLLEEYPLAEKYLTRSGSAWKLETDICGYAGACRFFAGLSDEIKIAGSSRFREYARNFLQEQLDRMNIGD